MGHINSCHVAEFDACYVQQKGDIILDARHCEYHVCNTRLWLLVGPLHAWLCDLDLNLLLLHDVSKGRGYDELLVCGEKLSVDQQQSTGAWRLLHQAPLA
jgi:hypothetical protein